MDLRPESRIKPWLARKALAELSGAMVSAVNKRLSKKAAQAIGGNLSHYHSSASFWEIAIKLSGKGFDFEIGPGWNQSFPDELKRIGVPLASPIINDCRLLQELPKHHVAPFDRMLVCQAERLGFRMISVARSSISIS